MQPHDSAIRRLRTRIFLVLACKYALYSLALAAFTAGTAVLVLCAGFGVPRPALAWSLSALPLALAVAWVLARRRTPSTNSMRALLDHRSSYGGLLMAADEVSLGGWAASLPEPSSLRVRWQARPPARPLRRRRLLRRGRLRPPGAPFWATPRLPAGSRPRH